MHDTQTNDDQLLQTDEAIPNLDTSDTAVPSPASTNLTDTSGEVATTSQGQKNGTEKTLSRKQRMSKYDVTGELLDKLIGMQEKHDKVLMELKMKKV